MCDALRRGSRAQLRSFLCCYLCGYFVSSPVNTQWISTAGTLSHQCKPVKTSILPCCATGTNENLVVFARSANGWFARLPDFTAAYSLMSRPQREHLVWLYTMEGACSFKQLLVWACLVAIVISLSATQHTAAQVTSTTPTGTNATKQDLVVKGVNKIIWDTCVKLVVDGNVSGGDARQKPVAWRQSQGNVTQLYSLPGLDSEDTSLTSTCLSLKPGSNIRWSSFLWSSFKCAELSAGDCVSLKKCGSLLQGFKINTRPTSTLAPTLNPTHTHAHARTHTHTHTHTHTTSF